MRRVLTVLWRGCPSRSVGDLPRELVEHTVDHFRQDMRPGDALRTLVEEEHRSRRLLERGRGVLAKPRLQGPLTEEDFHCLHHTHGLPHELVKSLREE